MKQVIVLRKDLNMRKGKMVAQGAHASMAAVLEDADFEKMEWSATDFDLCMHVQLTPEMHAWLTGIFTKICVSVDSEEELIEIYEKAKAKGIPCSLIKDSGLTEFNNVPTHTAVAVGPHEREVVDEITGGLKLL